MVRRESKVVVGIGEVLWDRFSDGRREAGGAALNIAYHANRFGDRGVLASRIGGDTDGVDLWKKIGCLGIDCAYVQRDGEMPTGVVDVTLTEGIPTYRIHENVAYDFIELNDDWKYLAMQTDAVGFGTLCQRTEGAADALYGFLDACPNHCLRFLDVNLRKGFWSKDILDRSLHEATAVKLNDEELPLAVRVLGLGYGEDALERLVDTYGLKLGILTKGVHGCVLFSHTGERIEKPGRRVDAVDTVGAGDAFVSVAIHHMLRGASLERMAEAGNEYAAFITTRRSGSPPIDEGLLDRVLAR